MAAKSKLFVADEDDRTDDILPLGSLEDALQVKYHID